MFFSTYPYIVILYILVECVIIALTALYNLPTAIPALFILFIICESERIPVNPLLLYYLCAYEHPWFFALLVQYGIQNVFLMVKIIV